MQEELRGVEWGDVAHFLVRLSCGCPLGQSPPPLSFAAEVESLLDFLFADALVEPQVADTR